MLKQHIIQKLKMAELELQELNHLLLEVDNEELKVIIITDLSLVKVAVLYYKNQLKLIEEKEEKQL